MKLSEQNKIRWKQTDYLTLGRAVSQFNKKINELNAEEKKLYLPEKIEYKDIKGNITSRKELNRILNSLRRFSNEGAEEKITLLGGQEISKWEYQELKKQRQIATRRLNQEIKDLNVPKFNGISRVQMGSQRLREIEGTLKSINKLESLKGFEFKRIKERISSIGTLDYSLQKANIYRENIMRELGTLAKNNSDFEKVFDYFNSISSPITFYNIMQKSDTMLDFFVWYQESIQYGAFNNKSEIATQILKDYGIELDDTFEDIKENETNYDLKRRRRYVLVVNGKILTSSNDLNKIYELWKEYNEKGENARIIDKVENQLIR